MKIINLKKSTYQEEVLSSEKTVLIDFYADWCGPCKLQSPYLEQFSLNNQDIKVCKVNVDEEMELAEEFGISSIPTLVVIKNGELYKKSVGLHDTQKLTNLLQ